MSETTGTNSTAVNADATMTAAPEGVTSTLNRNRVETYSAPEPAWLKERRLHAWEVYEGTPMPTTRLEEWRYTDLRKKLNLDSLAWPKLTECEDDFGACPDGLQQAMLADHAASGHVWEIDGIVFHIDLEESLAEKGVVLTSLRRAIDSHPELLQDHLATEAIPPETGKFEALNGALWTDGILLHVPKGVRLDRPVRVTRWVSQPGVALFTRTLVLADSGSQVSLVDEILSEDLEAQTLVSDAVEIVARDGAQVQYVSLQRLGHGAFYQSSQRTLAQRDSTLDTLNVSMGATTSRIDLNARLLGPGANSDMLGLYFGDDTQHFTWLPTRPVTSCTRVRWTTRPDRSSGESFGSTRKPRKPTRIRPTGISSSPTTPGPTLFRTWRSRPTTYGAPMGPPWVSWTQSPASTS
jgi:Fe-S cluster assembly protein SufD